MSEGEEPKQDEPTKPAQRGVIDELWHHPWGRVFAISATIATVAWALRETASVTLPLLDAVGDVLLPLAVGFTIAYVFNPLVDAIQRRGLPRLIAATVLYLLVVVGCTLGTLLVVPPVIDQSTQLVARSFEAQAYLDYDGDGRWGQGEPALLEVDSQQGIYGEDRDGDGVIGPLEPHYAVEDAPVAIAPSLAGQVVAWIDDQRGGVRRLVGGGLQPRALRFLDLYRRETADLRGLLDEGLRIAREGQPSASWPAPLRVDPDALPDLGQAWDRRWPAAPAGAIEAAAAELPEPQRERWRRVVGFYGQLWALRHRQLSSTWGYGYSTEVAPEIDLARIPPEALAVAAPVLGADPAALEGAWRSFAISDEPVDQEATAAFLARLDIDATDGATYAAELLGRLRGEGGDSGLLGSLSERMSASLARGTEQASDYLAEQAAMLVTNVAGLLGLALDLILIPIYAFFLSLAMPGIRRIGRRYVPVIGRDHTMRLLHDIERAVAAFFRGRLIVCAICALLVWGGFAACGVPFPLLFGICIGLATAVPLSGLLFLVPACLLVVVEGGEGMGLRLGGAIAVYTVVQTLEISVFTPTIMGREVELHPVILIVALLLCGKLLGILGLILAVPIAATVRILAKDFALPKLRRMAEVENTMIAPRPDDLADEPPPSET